MNNKSLILSTIGLVLGVVSYFIFAILSVPALILGLIGLIEAISQKRNGENATIALIISIITIVISGFALILMIRNIILIYMSLGSEL